MHEPYWHGRDREDDDYDERQARYEEQQEMRHDYEADLKAERQLQEEEST